MKWIGQHIWDLISRFRDEVYLEDIPTGTIEAGSNLGLDINNKVVKATVTNDPGVSSIDDLTDVDTGSLAPVSGEILEWNGSNWVPGVREETLLSNLVINVPGAAAGDYVFGNLRGIDTIYAGDGTKTALDIIKEVMFTYGAFGVPELTVNDSESEAGALEFSRSFNVAFINGNSGSSVTASVTLEKNVDSAGWVPFHDFGGALTNNSIDVTISKTITLPSATSSFSVRAAVVYSEGSTDPYNSPQTITYNASYASLTSSHISISGPSNVTFNSTYPATTTVGITGTATNPNHALGDVMTVKLKSSTSANNYTDTVPNSSQTSSDPSFSVSATATPAVSQGLKMYYKWYISSTNASGTIDNSYKMYEAIYNADEGAQSLSSSPLTSAYDGTSTSVTFTSTVTNNNTDYGAYHIATLEVSNTGSSDWDLVETWSNNYTASQVYTPIVQVDATSADKHYRMKAVYYKYGTSTIIDTEYSSILLFGNQTTGNAIPAAPTMGAVGANDATGYISFDGSAANNNHSTGAHIVLSLQWATNDDYDTWTDASTTTAETYGSSVSISGNTSNLDFNTNTGYKFRFKAVFTGPGAETKFGDPTGVITHNISSWPSSGTLTATNSGGMSLTSTPSTFSATLSNQISGSNMTAWLQYKLSGGIDYVDVDDTTAVISGSTGSYSVSTTAYASGSDGENNRTYRLFLKSGVAGDLGTWSNDIEFYYLDETTAWFSNSGDAQTGWTSSWTQLYYQDGSNAPSGSHTDYGRQIFDGKNQIDLRIAKGFTRNFSGSKTFAVGQKIRIYRQVASISSSYGQEVDIIPFSNISDPNTTDYGSASTEHNHYTLIAKNDDASSSSSIDKKVKYTVAYWDDTGLYGSQTDTPTFSSSIEYFVKRAVCKMVVSTTALNPNSSDNDMQAVFDVTTAGKVNSDIRYDAHLDAGDSSSGTLTVADPLSLSCSSVTSSEYIYFFIPSFFFNWDIDPGDDFGGASGDGAQTQIDWVNIVSGVNYFYSITDGTGNSGLSTYSNADLTVMSLDAQIEPVPGETHARDYIVIRTTGVQASTQNNAINNIINTQ